MKYYLLLVIATCLFSIQFVLLKKFQQKHGESLNAVGLFLFIEMLTMCLLSFCLNGFKTEFTLFSFICAVIYAVTAFLTSYFGFKSLGVTNLSVYTLFLMVGGMVIPFIYGLFTGETPTLFKITGVVILIVSLIIPVDFAEKKKTGKAFIYYIGIFVFNGLIGVVTLVHSKSTGKVSDYSFLFWMSAVLAVIAFVTFVKNNRNDRIDIKNNVLVTAFCPIFYAVINGAANLITLYCAGFVDGSTQYPIITGGCIVFSCFTGLIFKEKIKIRTVLAALLAFAATVLFMF